MRTPRNRYTSRGHGDRGYRDELRDEFSSSGMEDSWRNEDYYFDRVQNRRGYSSRDHAGGNYWPASDQVRGQREDDRERYVPSFRYGRDRGESANRAYGYGNDGSPSMRDYSRWSEDREPEGYRGRNSRDYRQDYGDRDSYHYNPGDYDRGGYRRNEEAMNYNRYTDRDDNRFEERRGDPHAYGEYESYPRYSDGRNDEWPSRSDRFRNRPEGSSERRRPNIREKRY